MASIRNSVPGTGYGNAYVDALVWGGTAWNTASGSIKIWFGQSGDFAAASAVHGPSDILTSGLSTRNWTKAEKAVFDYAIQVYESVCGLKFELAGSAAEANVVWWKMPLDGSTLGLHEVPDKNQIWGYFDPTMPSWNWMNFGGDGLNTVLHEFGHGMGLAHPHDGGTGADATTFPGVTDSGTLGPNGLNQGIWTVMSYNPGWGQAGYDLSYGNQAGLGAFDIAALQALYGKNMETGQGSNVYALPTLNTTVDEQGWYCLWDAGGLDTITAARALDGVVIDLRAATLEPGDSHAGGFISREKGVAGGYTIANGVTIENATGGRFADRLQGNSAGNVLRGADGADTLAGGSGDDILFGGAGSDRLSGGAGYDVFVFDTRTSRDKNVDRIDDFNPAYDSIRLENKIYTALGSGSASKPAAFKADMFIRAKKAQDLEDRVIYDAKSGALSYDADGSGAGAPMKFATLGKNLKLNHHDFFVV
ncbi:M10 family metallopeptidase C-terminal domain-containing protein [Microvirga sp. HBU67558]|uniref:M10 family metallopeptidase C-terminal domain-containing protein n=1 Tax=Microvirga TaxID=186650 RepID=UPI001B35A2E4|nr:M10 family metallopeptidase C-terminal domain-containing protein [Microvirga sp. HBU67655]MBQ0823171.1 M10 family metallopeptidase C-terminal domain-containing protein [Microvirga sp. HBU67558]